MKTKSCTSPVFACAGLTACALSLWAGLAPAQDVKEAEERFKKGLNLVDEGDCKNAVIEFEESYKLYPTTVVLYNLALCYDDLHKYAKAMKYYRQYVEEAKKDPSKKGVTAVQERIGKLEKYLGTLAVTCNVKDAAVSVDDEEIGTAPLENVYVETGDHTVTLEKEGFQTFSKKIKVVSGKTVSVDATLLIVEKEPEGQVPVVGTGEEKPDRKTLKPVIFWCMLGVTIGLGGGAAAVGALNLVNHNKFKDTPYDDRDKWKDLKDKGEIYNAVFLALIGATGAAAVTTVALAFFTNFKKREKKTEEDEDLELPEETASLSFAPLEGGGMLVVTVPIAF